MSSLIILVVVLLTVVVLYLQGSIARGVLSIILAVCAAVVAFSFFELLANLLITREKITPWAQPVAFGVLFVLSFTVFQAIGAVLLKQKISFGDLPEKVGRIVCGLLLGLILAGIVLTLLAMAPLPTQYPYERFAASNPDPSGPSKALPNADGLATGLFSVISKGSMSGKQSFATLHPGFIDQLYLNRIAGSEITLVTSSEAIQVPNKDGLWQAREGLTTTEGEALSPRPGHMLMVARIGIRRSAIRQAGRFALSQVRLICKERSANQEPLKGTGVNVYPVGYMASANAVHVRRLPEVVALSNEDFGEENIRYIDFVFNVPNGYVPILAQFKGNNSLRLSAIASGDQIPAPIGLRQSAPASPGDAGAAGDNQTGTSDNRRPGSSGRTGLSPVGEHLVGGALDEDLRLDR